ncbi:hypothetical protein HZS_4707 [Henneguya salminicola]|nr:hypothetical protein HZS_4707 [Henneguya salminicola]
MVSFVQHHGGIKKIVETIGETQKERSKYSKISQNIFIDKGENRIELNKGESLPPPLCQPQLSKLPLIPIKKTLPSLPTVVAPSQLENIPQGMPLAINKDVYKSKIPERPEPSTVNRNCLLSQIAAGGIKLNKIKINSEEVRFCV